MRTVSAKDPDMTLEFKRILVPLDFSAGSTRALDYAFAMAVKFDASLHLVHVCEVPGMMTASMDAYAIAYTDWSQRLGEEAETAEVLAQDRSVPPGLRCARGHAEQCAIAAHDDDEIHFRWKLFSRIGRGVGLGACE